MLKFKRHPQNATHIKHVIHPKCQENEFKTLENLPEKKDENWSPTGYLPHQY